VLFAKIGYVHQEGCEVIQRFCMIEEIFALFSFCSTIDPERFAEEVGNA
jgi:hypothetical protein